MDRALGAPGVALDDLPARQRLTPFVRHYRASEEFRPAPKAVACNLVEEPLGPLQLTDNVISVPIRASGLATVIVH
jgi:hypothetical protein